MPWEVRELNMGLKEKAQTAQIESAAEVRKIASEYAKPCYKKAEFWIGIVRKHNRTRGSYRCDHCIKKIVPQLIMLFRRTPQNRLSAVLWCGAKED